MVRRRLGKLGILLLLAAAWAAGGFTSTEPLMPFARPDDDGPGGGFSFAVYGDVQDNHRRGHDQLVERLRKERNLELVFNTGDISPDGGRDYAESFYPAIRELAARVPFFPSPGNHDVAWGSPESRLGFRRFFSPIFSYLAELPDNQHLDSRDGQKLWYALRHENALFIVLDSNLLIDEGKYRKTHRLPAYRDFREEQTRWLRRVLQRHATRPEVRARFVFFHHSPLVTNETRRPLGLGGHPGHSRMMLEEPAPEEPAEDPVRHLLDLFRWYRVTAVFSGHEHYYERWQEEIREGGSTVHRLHWLVTGLGGVKPRGRPEYEAPEIERFLGEFQPVREYLSRAGDLSPGWSSTLAHAYPTQESPDARFHHYVRVWVGRDIRFETVDVQGRVRDSGAF